VRSESAHIQGLNRDELRGDLFPLRLPSARLAATRALGEERVACAGNGPTGCSDARRARIRWRVGDRGRAGRTLEGRGVHRGLCPGDLPQLAGPKGVPDLRCALPGGSAAALASRAIPMRICASRLAAVGSLRTAGNAPLTIELGRLSRRAVVIASSSITRGPSRRWSARARTTTSTLRYRNGFAMRVPGFKEHRTECGIGDACNGEGQQNLIVPASAISVGTVPTIGANRRRDLAREAAEHYLGLGAQPSRYSRKAWLSTSRDDCPRSSAC